MKKSIISTIVILFITISVKSQITFENKYPIQPFKLKLCNLTNGGYKYYWLDQTTNQIKMYNANHTIFKTINVTPPTTPFVYNGLLFISDNLFNSDNLVEFVINYYKSPSTYQSILFNENNINLFTSNSPAGELLNISGNYKWKLPSTTTDSTFIYGLPGSLPCEACGGPTSIVKNNTTTNTIPNAYPNPTSTQITIPYTLTNSDTKGKINIYDINGKIVKEYNVDNTFDNLILDTQEFSAGTYYYNLTTNSGVSDAKKIIVIK